MNKQGIISFDLDQTLLDHSIYRIPESALKAVEKLRERFYIVLSTGRDMDNYYSREYKEQVGPDAIIHMNGTKITVGDKMIYDHEMDRELLERIFSYADKAGYAVGVTIGDEDYYLHQEIVRAMDLERWGECGRKFRDAWKLLDGRVRTLAYIGRDEGAKDLEAHFPELKCLLFAGKRGADVVEKEASKAKGLQRLCDYYGYSMKDVIAFGDSMNDYEMICQAGLGIAMGNAIEELKEVADYITTSVSDDGIWNGCQHFHFFVREEETD